MIDIIKTTLTADATTSILVWLQDDCCNLVEWLDNNNIQNSFKYYEGRKPIALEINACDTEQELINQMKIYVEVTTNEE